MIEPLVGARGLISGAMVRALAGGVPLGLGHLPETRAEFVAEGLPVGSEIGIYLCGESSGNLADTGDSGNTLTAIGTPAYEIAVAGTNRVGVRFDSTNEEFRAADAGVYDLDAVTSVTFLMAISMPDDPAIVQGVVDKRSLGTPDGYHITLGAGGSGVLQAVVDDGPDRRTVTSTVDYADGSAHLLAVVVDRVSDDLIIRSLDESAIVVDMGGVIGTLVNGAVWNLGHGPAGFTGDDLTVHYFAPVIGVAYSQAQFEAWAALHAG